MATKNVRAGDIITQISTTSLANARDPEEALVIVCEQDSNWDTEVEVSTEDTKCGPFQSVGSAVDTIGGTGVVAGDPSANQATSKELKDIARAGSVVYFVRKNLAFNGITAGDASYLEGNGYFTQVNETANQSDKMAKFTWALAVNAGSSTTVPAP